MRSYWCVSQGVRVLKLRDAVSLISVMIYLMSFTSTFFSPLIVRFVAVKDSPKFDEPCDKESSSMCSGSSTGTLYFGSPVELPYLSAFTSIKTEISFTHQLTCYQTGCHLLTYSPSVITTRLTVSTNCHHYRGRPVTTEKENNPYLCDSRLDSAAM